MDLFENDFLSYHLSKCYGSEEFSRMKQEAKPGERPLVKRLSFAEQQQWFSSQLSDKRDESKPVTFSFNPERSISKKPDKQSSDETCILNVKEHFFYSFLLANQKLNTKAANQQLNVRTVLNNLDRVWQVSNINSFVDQSINLLRSCSKEVIVQMCKFLADASELGSLIV